MKRPTISDIARRAGVTKSAVSYALNGQPGVSTATRERMGIRVPADVSILSWDDSATCEVIHPSVTAQRRDIPAAGAAAARILRELAVGGRPGSYAETAPVLQVRASSGPAPVPPGVVSR